MSERAEACRKKMTECQRLARANAAGVFGPRLAMARTGRTGRGDRCDARPKSLVQRRSKWVPSFVELRISKGPPTSKQPSKPSSRTLRARRRPRPLQIALTMIWCKAKLGVTMDIVVWLRSLGLGQYEAAFRENEINERVLP